jgi:transposase
LSEQGRIDLFYGDESAVSLLPCVPYGWQFRDEQAFMPSSRGKGVNCFGLINRNSDCWFRTTEQVVTAQTIVDWLDVFALGLQRVTVVVLDNAPIHQAKEVQARLSGWQERGLYIFFLPTYSPHLNIAETLWRKLKYAWLKADDYADKETLCYQVRQALAAVGTSLKIRFSAFQSAEKQSVQ